jgi:O-antigen/teichoic acid export membrane protein
MRSKLLRGPAAWSLVDQCILSLGNFAVTLLLARLLVPAEYGVYSLLVLLVLALLTIASSLLFYPLAVRGTVLPAEERAALFGSGLALLLVLCIPLALILAAVLGALGRPGLIAPAIAWLVLQFVQELLRRIFLAEMRYAAAVPGDAVSYLGQAAGILALAAAGKVTLVAALLVMAATSGLAALIQAKQVSIRLSTAGLLQTARQCWGIGGFSLASNVLSTMRMQAFPWALAALGGTIVTANYQAAQNLVMAANPILLGLCNVIPQAAARGKKVAGVAEAWRASRGYILLGAIPIFAYYALLLAWPQGGLTLLYGAASPYAALGLTARIMAAAALIAYVAEMICSYLHGLEAAQIAMRINMYGLVASILLGLPLTLAWGLTGSCIGLLASSIVRSFIAVQILAPMISTTRYRFASVANHTPP